MEAAEASARVRGSRVVFGLLLAHPFVFGLMVIVMMTIAMNMLMPAGLLARFAVTVGILAGMFWALLGLWVLSLEIAFEDGFSGPLGNPSSSHGNVTTSSPLGLLSHQIERFRRH